MFAVIHAVVTCLLQVVRHESCHIIVLASKQMSITMCPHAAASQPVRMALMDERLQQLLTEIDGSANAEKVGGSV